MRLSCLSPALQEPDLLYLLPKVPKGSTLDPQLSKQLKEMSTYGFKLSQVNKKKGSLPANFALQYGVVMVRVRPHCVGGVACTCASAFVAAPAPVGHTPSHRDVPQARPLPALPPGA